MSGKAKTVKMCGETLGLGDYIVVVYEEDDICGGKRLTGYISEIWSPEMDNHLQARVGKTPDDKNGWCFHDKDHIENLIPAVVDCPTKR
ncbi:hypothetical protein LCGC14_2938640 [marine sediment metagenome]|uniref:Uncharacterized protein n=1 Tax=marine sediment metagenome TaxID=412755 RepID=A0A0F8XJB2_9ZZZZ